MSEMVERVARAIAFVKEGPCDPDTVVRMAMEAMREPTDAMVNAADPHGIIMADFRAGWKDMIDEARK